jgi:hypothetical protein
MDLYISSLLLGAIGLTAMALSGLGHGHGHAGRGGHAGHSHSHGGHSHGAARGSGGSARGARDAAQSVLWAVMSPRVLFSFVLGFGAAGEIVRPFLSGPFQLAAAIAGGVVVERFLVAPLWNFAMRFASAPAVTLESSVADEATAVTSFDANGQGIVSVELDGQVVQVLATLQPSDRTLGVRVRIGQRVRIEEVQASSNRCTVSLL